MPDRLTQLEKLHGADPADPFLTYGIALEHAKTGDAAAAIQWLDKTLALDADYCYAYFQKARLLDESGDLDAARRTIRQGIDAARRCGDDKALGELTELLESMA